MLPAKVSTKETDNLERLGTKPSLTVAQLRSRGVEADGSVAGIPTLDAERPHVARMTRDGAGEEAQ